MGDEHEHSGPPHEPEPSKLQENPAEAAMYQHPKAPRREAHSFRPPATSNSHGYGHTEAQCCGSLRLSGKAGAHQIGKR